MSIEPIIEYILKSSVKFNLFQRVISDNFVEEIGQSSVGG